jgi:hypothetical protein
MTPRVKATPSLAILDALDVLAGQVRKLNPAVPDNIVLVLASGKTGRGAKHGHFAPDSWNEGHHEILISSESLARGAEATLGTLIHELAHASANASEIQDTSNKGRYHNKRFKKIAEAMGIELAEAPTIGWSVTTLPDVTAAVYRTGLDKLTKSLTTYRRGLNLADTATAEPKVKNKTKATMECDCHDPVSVSIQWFERMGDALECRDCANTYVLSEH